MHFKINQLEQMLDMFYWNSKRPSDFKQNGSQEKKHGSVFHAFSHGVFRFVASVRFKN